MLVKMRINSRKLLAISSCILAGFVSVSSYAFTLGDIRLDSALNQPLDAEIQLLELDGLDQSQILVSLGSQADFQRVGVDPLPLLNELEFEVEVLSGDLGLIHISSQDAIVEPYLNFVLNVRWPSGRVIREYTVLLDLPTFSANPAPTPAPAETAPAPTPRPQPATPAPDPSPAPAPQVAQEPETEPDPDPERQIPEPANSNTPSDTVVIQPGDSMWNIALATRPDNSVSVQQMMLAIQRANTGSDAFINNNINGIRAGRVLRIPDRQEIAAISQQQAVNQVALQNQQFSGGQPLAVNTTQGTADNNRDELSIITDSEPADSQQVSGLNDTVRALENELAISEESLDAARLENEELGSRLGELEEQIGILENIIAIEDQRMAELQAQLTEQQNGTQTADTNVLAVNDATQPPAPQPTPDTTPPAPQTTPEPASSNPAIVTPRISNFLSSTVGMGLALLVLLALVVGFLVARNRSSIQDEDEFDPTLEDEDEDELDTNEFNDDLNNEAVDPETEEFATPAFSYTDDFDDSADSDADGEQDSEDDERSFNNASEDDEYADSNEDSDEDDYHAQDEEDESQAKTGFLAGLLARFSRKKPAEDEYDEEYEDEYDEDLDLSDAEPESDDEQALMPEAVDEQADEQIPEEDIEVDELLANSPEDKDAEQDELLNLEADEAEEDAEATETTGPDLSEAEQVQETEDDELDIEFTGLDDGSEDAVADDALESIEDSETETKANAADEAEEVFEFNLDESAEDSTESVASEEVQEAEPEDMESLEFAVDDEPSAEAETDTATEEELEDDLETFDFGKISLDEPAGDNTENASAEAESDEVEEIEFVDEPDSIDNPESADNSQDDGKTSSSLGKLGIADALMDDDSDEEELEMITDQDEVATKLDLAVAYQAMEDLEGAREILQEVMAEGNDEQIAEAKRLLEEWGDS